MKVYKFKCKDCGSKSYEKLDDKTYKCLYCGCIEEVILDKPEPKPEPAKEQIESKPNAEEAAKSSENKTKTKVSDAKHKAEENFSTALLHFLLCFFLGVFGVHRFVEGKILTGLLFVFTGGLFFFGYAIDCVVRAVRLIGAGINLVKNRAE